MDCRRLFNLGRYIAPNVVSETEIQFCWLEEI